MTASWQQLFGVLFLSACAQPGSIADPDSHLEATLAGTVPPPAGMTLWLRADKGIEAEIGDGVWQWRDQSGSGNHLTQTLGSQKPRFDEVGANGQPSLHFDGNDFLSSTRGMPGGSYTKVAVFSLDSYGSANNILSGASSHALWYGYTDQLQLWHNGFTFATSGFATRLGEVTVVVATYDASTELGNLYVDGAWVGGGTASAPGWDPGLQVGAFGGANHFIGDISELMVFDWTLSTSERDRVFDFLQGRYQTPSPVPDVTIASMPRSGQVLLRDGADRCTVSVEGQVDSAGASTVELEITRDGVTYATDSTPAVVGVDFSLSAEIDAGLWDHDVTVSLSNGVQSAPVAVRHHVTCGDAILLQGQSNTVAGDYWLEGLANDHQSHWVRSFGSASLAGADVPLDLAWGLADGEVYNGHASVGQWGLRMGEMLVAEHGIPLAILNGAVGGTAIALHQENVDEDNLDTIYGRMLYRAREAGIADGARAMVWYQGESDADWFLPYDDYYVDQFDLLYGSWLTDFGALEQTWLFQVRNGCGLPNTTTREHLRTLPDRHADVQVMSTTAVTGHDGCHFYYDGYRQLGERLFDAVSRDLYSGPADDGIDAPNPASARWTDSSRTAIEITFRAGSGDMVWTTGFEGDFHVSGASVLSGSASGDTVVLYLSGPSGAATLDYEGHVYDGPALANSRGVGALTFFDLPIAGP